MASVYLIRHGQASFDAEDYDQLSELGLRQATHVGSELRRRGVAIDRAISGTMRRQTGTVAACVAACGSGMSYATDSRWNEYDFADILTHHADLVPPKSDQEIDKAVSSPAGMRERGAREFQQMLDAGLREWILAGEDTSCARSWPAFSWGVRQALSELLADLGRGRTAVVVTSAGPIAAVCAGILELPAPDAVVALNRVQANVGITKVVRGVSGTNLVSFNEQAHLEGSNRDLLTYR